MLNKLGVIVKTHYFSVDGQNAFAMYDSPHLLKNVSNLKNTGYIINVNSVSCSYIEQLYEYDKTNRHVRICVK